VEVPDYSVLTKTEPLKKLVVSKKRAKGRSGGQITSRHRGGGYKKLYREVIFGEEKKVFLVQLKVLNMILLEPLLLL